MGTAADAAWKAADVAHGYLDDRRRAIPLWAEQKDLLCRLVDRLERPVQRFLDLGAGDGVLTEAILERVPASEAVLVDFSAPMLAAAAARLKPKSGRWRAVEADLASPGWIDVLASPAGYDLVLSGFCIHHLRDERKRQLYGEVFDLLAPGGAFLNMEHVSAPEAARGMLDERMIEDLIRLEQDSEEPRTAAAVAAEYHARPDAAANKLVDPVVQCGWLREIGFERVDLFFRWLELALFGGVKPRSGGGV